MNKDKVENGEGNSVAAAGSGSNMNITSMKTDQDATAFVPGNPGVCDRKDCNPMPCPGFIDLSHFPALYNLSREELIGKWA